ncbi:MAG TPA: prepilin peptidase [Gemmatimonadaceae bacterium]|jgi:leader peptidase (prepilin peptidase)/N-methyltransferase
MILARVYAFAFGAIFGSFLNVCILRWPKERSIVKPRSRCPHCGNQLQWFENIPIFSWVALRGRCRCCDEWISVQYPLIELMVAIGWVLAVNAFGPSFTAFRVAIFGTILVGVAVTDLRDYLIPDGFTLTGLVFALVTAAIAYVRADLSPFANPYDAIVGACAGAGMIAIVGWIGEIATGKEAMGLGDVTLMAFVGAALGPQRALITVFIGAMLGTLTFAVVVVPMTWARKSVARGAQTELALGAVSVAFPLVPFGVFLAPAALISLLWGDALIQLLIRG